MVYLGIDPGLSGGIAAINNGTANVWKMPKTDADIADLFRYEALQPGRVQSGGPDCFAMIEKALVRTGEELG